MKNITKALVKLKTVTKNQDHPLYSKYIMSDGEVVYACDGEDYIQIKESFPFIGAVNIFVLENVLNCIDSLSEAVQTRDSLKIEKPNYKTSLAIKKDVKMPKFDYPKNLKTVKVTKQLIDILKIASSFLGLGVYSNVYVDSEKIVATDATRLFYYKLDTGFDDVMAFNKKIINSLTEDVSVGAYKNNIVVKFEKGFAIFTADIIKDEYPINKIENLISTTGEGFNRICPIPDVHKAISQVSPVLHGEMMGAIKLINNNEELSVIADTSNGVSIVKLKSFSKTKSEIFINAGYLSQTPDWYDLFLEKGKLTRAVLKTKDSIIIIMGIN